MCRYFFIGTVFVLLAVVPIQAQVWDLNADSDATTNPQGAWSYGRSEDPNDPVPFTLHTNTFDGGPGGDLIIWDLATGHPNIAYNKGVNVLESHIAPGEHNMHPGSDPNPDYAKIRFTVPATVANNQLVHVQGLFDRPNPTGGNDDMHIIHNDGNTATEIFQNLGNVDDVPFDVTVVVNSGDWIDFAVGNHDGSEGGGAASVDFKITATGVHFADFEWQADNSAAWMTRENWSPSLVPGDTADNSSSQHTATFGSAITANRTITLDNPVSLRAINFVNANSYAIAGHGSVNLVASTVAEPDPTEIIVGLGDHQFQTIVNLENDTTAILANNSSLEFNNRLNLNGNTLTKTGPGTLAVSNTVVTGGGTIDVQGGTVVGAGAIGGNLVNGSTVSPGLPETGASVVPEPSTIILLWLATTAIFVFRNRRTAYT